MTDIQPRWTVQEALSYAEDALADEYASWECARAWLLYAGTVDGLEARARSEARQLEQLELQRAFDRDLRSGALSVEPAEETTP